MKYLIFTATAVAAMMLYAVPAEADSKFAGVARAEHGKHYSGERHDYRRDSRYRSQRYHRRSSRHSQRHEHDRRVTPFDQNRNWQHRNLASRYRHYDYRYGPRRDHRYDYRYSAGVRLGDCVYLTPHGLTVYYDGRRCD